MFKYQFDKIYDDLEIATPRQVDEIEPLPCIIVFHYLQSLSVNFLSLVSLRVGLLKPCFNQ